MKANVAFFESLGAPLKNGRWSWGATRLKDGAIILKVWNDEWRTEADGQKWVQIGFPSGTGNVNGWRERQEHIKAIESGAQCLLVMCEAEDVSADPRTVASLNPRTLAVGGEIKREEGKTWIRVVGYKSIFEVG
jgi:hypothetical protein